MRNTERGDQPALGPASPWSRWVLPVATIAFQVATYRQYGYFRDELYYLANGAHLDWGYVEHPPLIGLIAWLVRATLGDSLLAIRLLPAVAAGVTVWLAGATARELGGGRFAQALAALMTLAAPMYVGLFGVLSMNAFDVMFWAACWWILARLFRTGDGRLWLVFGASAGLGLQNKISILFLGFGVAAGVLLSRHRRMLLGPWIYAGGAIAGLIFLPHVLWQWTHGWPTLEFIANATRLKNVALSPAAFLAEQVFQAGPLTLPIWLAGLAYLLAARSAAPFRALGWAYVAVLVVMLVTNAKPYYLAPAYTVLFAAAGVACERVQAGRMGTLLRVAVIVVVIVDGLVAAPLAKGVLSEGTFVRYQAALGLAPRTDERHELSRLPQFYADMHGWPELAAAVDRVYRALPEADRSRACIFAQNYGQAGAIDLFGGRLGLPPAISAHNSYFLWGPRGCSGDVLIVVGDRRARLDELFRSVELAGTYTCQDCMPYENNKPIWVARDPRLPLASVWPAIKKFI